MNLFNTIIHLLPRGRAWSITINKQLRQLIEGLSEFGEDVRNHIDLIWLDIFPDTTRELEEWEVQFGLPPTELLTEAERRTRLDAAWKAVGGQSPRYIQDTLQSYGFDVYVHEWWVPGSSPAISRNPLLYLRREVTFTPFIVECGEGIAECGEALAESGNSLEPLGYPLVNKIFNTTPDLSVLCGEPFAEAGDPDAECGNFFRYNFELKNYIVPDDSTKWPYFLYIGGQTFGTLANVPTTRRNEFEALCLKICPSQQWLGILVEYT